MHDVLLFTVYDKHILYIISSNIYKESSPLHILTWPVGKESLSLTLYQFPRVLVKMYHTLGELKQKFIFLHSSVGWKSELKVLAVLAPSQECKEKCSKPLPASFRCLPDN